MIFDQKLEHHLLSGLLRKPEEYLNIQSFFSEQDIYADDSLLRQSIFSVIKRAVEGGEDVNAIIVAQRLESMGMKFDEELPVGKFIESLALRSVPEGSVYKTAIELKKLSERRKTIEAMGRATDKLKALPRSASITEIQDIVDKEVNAQMSQIDSGDVGPVNIYDDLEYLIEDRGNNPIKDFGMMGPYKRVNEIYGSLVRPGNITVIVARAKSGKTTIALDYTTFIADKYDVNVLHFDNGEMSKEELQFRQAAALTGVPLYLLETGQWRQAGETIIAKVRDGLKRAKKLKFYYYCVGGMSPDEMVAAAKKFYYSVVGRGKEMILSFDYLKSTGQLTGNNTEYQFFGEVTDKFKKLIQKDILFDNKPMISLFTSVQSNRSGIVSNRRPDQINDDESQVGGSDKIIQLSTHLAILRKKTTDEILEDGEQFGTHKLIFRAARHLGQDTAGHLEPVKDGDRLKDNFINLRIKNFHVEECGDLRDIVDQKSLNTNLEKTHSQDGPTDF